MNENRDIVKFFEFVSVRYSTSGKPCHRRLFFSCRIDVASLDGEIFGVSLFGACPQPQLFPTPGIRIDPVPGLVRSYNHLLLEVATIRSDSE